MAHRQKELRAQGKNPEGISACGLLPYSIYKVQELLFYEIIGLAKPFENG